MTPVTEKHRILQARRCAGKVAIAQRLQTLAQGDVFRSQQDPRFLLLQIGNGIAFQLKRSFLQQVEKLMEQQFAIWVQILPLDGDKPLPTKTLNGIRWRNLIFF
ncbi:MAG: hypothetical protein AAFP79_02985 [Pseudomonadota bacterium]